MQKIILKIISIKPQLLIYSLKSMINFMRFIVSTRTCIGIKTQVMLTLTDEPKLSQKHSDMLEGKTAEVESLLRSAK